jgi:hypothetical protein
MKLSSAFLFGTVCVQLSVLGQAQSRTFIDDAGITHTTDKASPTFMASARTSLALMQQFGYDDGVGIKGQLVGSYGPYRPRGSQMDLEKENAKPIWAADPTYKEVQFLKSLPYNFSPDCYDNNQQCKTIEKDTVAEANPDMWIYINNGVWFTGPQMKTIVDDVLGGSAPVFIDTNSYGEGCITWNPATSTYTRDHDKCSARSLVDVIEKTNELSAFLGIEDKQKNMDEDKNRMCLAAKRLSRAAQNAQNDGLRILAANAFIQPFITGSSVTLAPLDPLHDAYLRTYEELGVPILHPGVWKNAVPEVIPTNDWFPNCAERQDMTECNNEAIYPVDIWLMEGRRLPNGTSDESDFLLRYFPEKALLGNQYTHWPMNDGPISYRSISRSFHVMASILDSSSRVYPRTECSNVDVTSEAYLKRNTGGIGPGGYACYDQGVHQSKYLQCPEGMGSSVIPEDDDGWMFYEDEVTDSDGSGGMSSNTFAGFLVVAVATAIGFVFATSIIGY